MFLFGGGSMQIKGKRKKKNQGGGGGWGQQQQGGWGQQQGGGWGGQQQGGGWGGQQQGGWGQQQEGGWGGQQQGGGWGGQQQGGWGGQQQGGWGQQGGFFGGSQNYWGNDFSGHDWVEEQKKRNDFNIFGGGQENNISINEIIEKQIIFMEPSPAQKRLDQIRQSGEVFEDETFPPNDYSLSGEWGKLPEWDPIQWSKVSDFMGAPQIFKGKVEPGDIKQGYLGDCYFLAGLAALAERPDRIFNLFLFQELNDSKYFSVKMIYKGKWVRIDMDEQIPVLYNKPAFSKANEDELWVVLLEKAWAKLYTSYKRIEAGYPEEAIHDLTGAPIKSLYFQHYSFNKEEDWQYLVDASRREYSMVGSTQPGSDTNKSTSGVVQGHAYTILNATYIEIDGQQERVVQCRNPWGKGEFTGRWSDEDPIWEQVSESEKQRVGYHPNKNDGIFFMSYDDFIVQFRALTIAEIDDDASYIYKSFTDPDCQGAYFKVQIFEEGEYSFQLDKTPERIYPENVQEMYRYPQAHLEYGKFDGQSVERYQGTNSKRRTLLKKCHLGPGAYIVWAKIDYDKDFEDKFVVNLAVYASTACNVTLASQEEAAIFSGDPGVQWTGNESGGNWGGNQGGGDGWGGNQGGGDGW